MDLDAYPHASAVLQTLVALLKHPKPELYNLRRVVVQGYIPFSLLGGGLSAFLAANHSLLDSLVLSGNIEAVDIQELFSSCKHTLSALESLQIQIEAHLPLPIVTQSLQTLRCLKVSSIPNTTSPLPQFPANLCSLNELSIDIQTLANWVSILEVPNLTHLSVTLDNHAKQFAEQITIARPWLTSLSPLHFTITVLPTVTRFDDNLHSYTAAVTNLIGIVPLRSLQLIDISAAILAEIAPCLESVNSATHSKINVIRHIGDGYENILVQEWAESHHSLVVFATELHDLVCPPRISIFALCGEMDTLSPCPKCSLKPSVSGWGSCIGECRGFYNVFEE
ncbi:hypothetical protein VNI00_004014 [Paramarasmius palmivorus]|uniref:Uncharacterized protein n=1 Tax=Paramarasmius palmivorus TaxID=297713 RepID=A0AAW0DRU5_9AGAR